ncbi:MAG: hypothetical protein ACR2JV_00600 [Gaiellales bacterium]
MQRLLRLAPVLVLVALAGLLAACGGSDLASDPGKVLASATLPPPGPNASQLKAEFTPASGASSSTGSDGLGGLLSGPISIDATSQGDAATGVTADAKVTVGPLDIPVSVRQDSTDAWVQVGGQWYALGAPLGIDFAAVAKPLASVSQLISDPKATAVEDVGGISCDRISGTLRPGAQIADQLGGLAQNLPIDLSALTKGQAQISVWVGRDDHQIHRIQLDTAAAGQDSGLMIDLSVVPADPVTVTAPADAKPLSDLVTTVLGKQAGKVLGNGSLGDLGKALSSGTLDLGKLLGGGGSGGLDLGKILGGMGGGSTT